VNIPSEHLRTPVPRDGSPPQFPEWGGWALTYDEEVALIVLGSDSHPDGTYPKPVIAAAIGGGFVSLVSPAQIGQFLITHSDCKIVCEQAGPLHGMLGAYFTERDEREALQCLWDFSRTGRLLDVTLLDQLLDMAEHGVEKNPCRLAEIATSRCSLALPDAREITSKTEEDPVLRRYAIQLVDALLESYLTLRRRADEITRQHWKDDDADTENSPFTLWIQ
jgi:hypothetical protein